VSDKEHSTQAGRSKRNPALLIAGGFVALRQSVWIIKDKGGGVEAEVMLEQISAILLVVPFETHGRWGAAVDLR